MSAPTVADFLGGSYQCPTESARSSPTRTNTAEVLLQGDEDGVLKEGIRTKAREMLPHRNGSG